MDGHTSMGISAFAATPTQYEVKNWLFGRGHVFHPSVSHIQRHDRVRTEGSRGGSGRDSRDAGDEAISRPLRHSYFGLSSGSPKQERAKLKKGHRRAWSNGHHLSTTPRKEPRKLQEGPQRGGLVVNKDAVAADNNRHSRYSRHMETSRQRRAQGHRFSLHLRVLKGARDSVASSTGSGDTLVGSAGNMESFSKSPICRRFSASSSLKPQPHPPSPSSTCDHLPAATFPIALRPAPPSNSSRPTTTNLTAPTAPFDHTKIRIDPCNICSSASPESPISASPIMDERFRAHKALNAFRQCKAPSHSSSSSYL